MSENWKIQVSPKLTDGTLINLRAETPEEAATVLDWAIANAAKIGEAVQAINGVAVVGAAFPGAQVSVQAAPEPAPAPAQGGWNTAAATPPPAFAQQPQQAYAQAAYAQAPAPQAAPAPAQPGADGLLPAQFCAHGAMQLRHSKPGAQRQWSAYMCPTPKGTPGQCSPIDAKTGKSWGS